MPATIAVIGATGVQGAAQVRELVVRHLANTLSADEYIP